MCKKRKALRRQLNEIQKEVDRISARLKMAELAVEVERRKRLPVTWTAPDTWKSTGYQSQIVKLMADVDRQYNRLNRKDKDVDL